MTTAPFRGRPVAVHPTTGEVLTVDGINDRILALSDKLETEANTLTEKIHELARVTALYDQTYDDALLASDARNKEQREAEARQACRLATTPLGYRLADRRNELEHEVRAMREHQHTLRAILSGWQTAAKNVQAAMGGYGAAS